MKLALHLTLSTNTDVGCFRAFNGSALVVDSLVCQEDSESIGSAGLQGNLSVHFAIWSNSKAKI